MDPALKQYLVDLAAWYKDRVNEALGPQTQSGGNSTPPPPPPPKIV